MNTNALALTKIKFCIGEERDKFLAERNQSSQSVVSRKEERDIYRHFATTKYDRQKYDRWKTNLQLSQQI